jgi:hypothetical protein
MDDAKLTAFLDRVLSASTVTVPMTDLFASVTGATAEARVEIIQRLSVLAEKRRYKLYVDGILIVLSIMRSHTDNNVSAKSGYSAGRPYQP